MELENRLSSLITEAHTTEFDMPSLKVISQKSYGAYCEALHLVNEAPLALSFVADAKQALSFDENLLQRYDGHLLVTGPPGFGKTSFCRHNVLNDLDVFTLGQAKVLPVYVPLHELSGVKLERFEYTFLRPEFLDFLNKRDDLRIRLYLDGLDEVSPHAQQRSVMEAVRNAVTGAV